MARWRVTHHRSMIRRCCNPSARKTNAAVRVPKPINAKATRAVGSWIRLSVHPRHATTMIAKAETPTTRSISTE